MKSKKSKVLLAGCLLLGMALLLFLCWLTAFGFIMLVDNLRGIAV